jgi:pSer/pThr/pTyr-binding forkhead associated (FHA) protein
MSGALLTFLKYIFLAVLYLFFLRVLRAVWSELREPQPAGDASLADIPPAAEAPVRPTPIDRLVVLAPPERAGESFRIGTELTVGRAPTNTVTLPDDTFVSQLHARVFRRENDCFVEDLGSTNGTFLNGQRVGAPVALRIGDRIQIGNTVMGLAS